MVRPKLPSFCVPSLTPSAKPTEIKKPVRREGRGGREGGEGEREGGTREGEGGKRFSVSRMFLI